MVLLDVNVLVYAHREDTPDHSTYLNWLEALINSNETFGISDLVLSAVMRVVTHPRIFNPPSSLDDALAFTNAIRSQPNCLVVAPGRRHWDIFNRLCREANAKGNLIPDAYHAALAIESGCEWISTDRDFSRFPNLRWRKPF